MLEEVVTCRNQAAVRSKWRWSLVALVVCVIVAGNARRAISQTDSSSIPVTTLELGRPLERELAGGQSHSYRFNLSAGQYVKIAVEQRGIDVVLSIVGPDGKQLASYDGEVRLSGVESAEFVAGPAGGYVLNVAAKYRFVPAARYHIQMVALREATDNDKLVQARNDQIARVTKLYFAGKYDEALPVAEGLLAELEKAGEGESQLMGKALNRLGGIYHGKGDYAKAQSYFLRARSVLEKSVGPDHPDTLMVLYNLGIISKEQGDYAKAVQFHQQALDARERVLGQDNTLVAASLTDLATVYRVTGDYAKAEELQLRALAIREKLFGPEDESVGQVLFNLGALYGTKKEWAKAAEVTERSLRIWEKILGPDHEDVGRILNNLSVQYKALGEYDKAEAASVRAIAISEKTIGPDNVRLADQLESLADIYAIKEEYAKAENLYRRGLRIREQSLPADHPELAFSLMGLADLFYYQGQYEKAQPLFERALAIREKALGKDHPDVAETLNDMARFYEAKGDLAQALSFQQRANSVVEREIELQLFAGSQSQQADHFASLAEQTNQTISLQVRLAPNDQKACDLAANTILQRKGRVQDEIAGSMASLQRQMGANGRALLDQLNDTTSRLAKLVLDGPGHGSAEDHQQQVKKLEEEREGLEREISHRTGGFLEQTQTVTLSAVEAAIPDNAALIEFAIYRPLVRRVADKQKAYGEPRYVAYVIRHQGEVRWQDLGPGADIDVMVSSLRQALADPNRKDVQTLARALDAKVMQPVRDLIGPASHLLISPDGPLNLLPFAALSDPQGHYLVETQTITYLTSGRDLLRLQVARQSKSPPVVIAAPTFGNPPLLAESGAPNRDRVKVSSPARVDYSQVFFGPLPGVADEVRALRELLPNAKFLTGDLATKTALESVEAPSILHIATHGFFLSEPGEQATQTAGPATRGINANAKIADPLLRSGLALAGANRKDESGILTALEASGLNLWGTKIVVLSACDSGVGQVRNGEGVYGLRRALVLAGAQTQLMSLWPVSDRATRDLMIGFYKNLISGHGRGDSLRQAQLQVLNSPAHRHPYYWASFIQTGEWANLDGKR
ncbi:MAG TPA: CHAT domain-containing protein [Pyrinomonadaceae bacterium]|nr:CHAT domain-containing protein [Pyrinomonadaceae bacterium]